MKEFEVRASFPGGPIGKSTGIFRIVLAESEQAVKDYFSHLCWSDIYVREVPVSGCHTLVIK